MSLTIKLLIITGLTYLATLITIPYPLGPLNFFILNSILFSLLALMLYHWAGIKDFLKIAKQLKNHKAESIQHIDVTSNTTEAKLITNKINLAYEEMHELKEDMQHEIQEQLDIRIKEILEKNEIKICNHTNSIEPLTPSREYLQEMSKYDYQTSLPNRVFFNEILNKTINHSKRHQKLIAVLLVEVQLDNTLDTVSHEQMVKEISTRFTFSLRTEDILAKLDGAEFIVLLSDIKKPKFASTVAEKLLACCRDKVKTAQGDITISANVGICIFPTDGNTLEELLSNVENTLYKAKSQGRNTYHFYTQSMDLEAREFLELGAALKKSFYNNELAIYYQPKFHLKNGGIIALEALMRWEHPEFGIVSPAKFIPLAEENGLIMPLSEWALKEACEMNKYWQDKGYAHTTIAVNISAAQFNHPNFVKSIYDVLEFTQLNPQYLELEINEKTIMENVENASKILEDLRGVGVQLAIDHFGMGYTSISYLKQFPISAIKIDQSFIKGVPHIPNDSAITTAFINLAHNLGVEVVAEGVETAEQVQFLTANNCDIVQGYFLSHPLPAIKIVQQFKKLKDEVMV